MALPGRKTDSEQNRKGPAAPAGHHPNVATRQERDQEVKGSILVTGDTPGRQEEAQKPGRVLRLQGSPHRAPGKHAACPVGTHSSVAKCHRKTRAHPRSLGGDTVGRKGVIWSMWGASGSQGGVSCPLWSLPGSSPWEHSQCIHNAMYTFL